VCIDCATLLMSLDGQSCHVVLASRLESTAFSSKQQKGYSAPTPATRTCNADACCLPQTLPHTCCEVAARVCIAASRKGAVHAQCLYSGHYSQRNTTRHRKQGWYCGGDSPWRAVGGCFYTCRPAHELVCPNVLSSTTFSPTGCHVMKQRPKQ
jgi:hypothetical protein